MMYPSLAFDAVRPVDLIAMGRVAVDLYSENVGVSLKEATHFRKYLGGCAGNIAVGTARLGLSTMMFSCVGQDEMGAFLRSELQREGVDTRLLSDTPNHLTGLVLLGIKPPHDFPLIFYRKDCADMQLSASQISRTDLVRAKAILLTGTGLSTPAMNQTSCKVALQANISKTMVVFDLDYRPVLWGLTALGNGESRYIASQAVSATYQGILPLCDLIVGTEEEFRIAAGIDDITLALQHIQSVSKAILVVKAGDRGAKVLFADKSVISAKPYPVEVLNVLGAGDGFMSGLLAGLLRKESWETALTYANACGALVVTRHGCASAIPYQNELAYFIEDAKTNPQAAFNPELARLHAKPQQGLILKNPQGFVDGLHTLINMETDKAMGMNFKVLKLRMGQRFPLSEQYEFALLLMTGRVSFHIKEQCFTKERRDYFSEAPIVLHGPRHCQAWIEAHTDAELLWIETENVIDFAPMLFDENNMLENDHRGKGLLEDTSSRLVRTVFDKRNRPESNLVLGEIITYPGRWSSYPSHAHAQPEVYHYRFSEPQGYAFGECGQEVLRIAHYDTYKIPADQTHAHCVAPGYALYTLWFIRHLENDPYLVPTFVPEHQWTRTIEANQRVWR